MNTEKLMKNGVWCINWLLKLLTLTESNANINFKEKFKMQRNPIAGNNVDYNTSYKECHEGMLKLNHLRDNEISASFFCEVSRWVLLWMMIEREYNYPANKKNRVT